MENNNSITKAKMDSLKAFMSTPESIAVADEEFEKTMAAVSSKSQMLEKAMIEIIATKTLEQEFDVTADSKPSKYINALPQEERTQVYNLLAYISDRISYLKRNEKNIFKYNSKIENLRAEIIEDLEDIVPSGFLPKEY